jgi:hypothetical protein
MMADRDESPTCDQQSANFSQRFICITVLETELRADHFESMVFKRLLLTGRVTMKVNEPP